MRRRKSLGRKIVDWFFIGYLPGILIFLVLDSLENHLISINSLNRDTLLLSIFLSPLFYFGIPYCVKTHKEIVELFRQANWIQKLILGIFTFLIFGRIIRVIIQTFKQS